jgi:acyl-CoA reductase-like NAD-dependent aldehyde dehydrogenase
MQPNIILSFSESIKEVLKSVKMSVFINGQLRHSASDKSITVFDPATEDVLTSIADTTPDEIQEAVTAAQTALDNAAWRKMTPSNRERILLKFADLVEQNTEEVAELLVLEQGKLKKDALGEVDACVRCFRYFAGFATKIQGSTLDVSLVAPDTDYFAYTKREPVGVVAAITPWNVPVMMFAWKVAPALACGCTMVLKPSEDTPLTALYLAQLFVQVGLPKGVLNVITGYGHTVGDALVKNKGINKITFTGSTATGRIIGKNAMDSLKRVTLELGGKNPVLVLDDADISKVPTAAARGIFYNQGQVCVSGSRIYLPQNRYDSLVGQIGDIAKKMTVGSGFDPSVSMGPLVSKTHQNRVLDYIESGKKDGVELVTGGGKGHEKGYFVEPTILANPNNKPMKVATEEIFGPVLIAMPYDDIEDLIQKANNSDYGLSASIWSQDISTVHRLIDRLKVGMIYVNSPVRSDPNLPLGGYKQSGIGRELGHSAIEQYTEIKSVCIAY